MIWTEQLQGIASDLNGILCMIQIDQGFNEALISLVEVDIDSGSLSICHGWLWNRLELCQRNGSEQKGLCVLIINKQCIFCKALGLLMLLFQAVVANNCPCFWNADRDLMHVIRQSMRLHFIYQVILSGWLRMGLKITFLAWTPCRTLIYRSREDRRRRPFFWWMLVGAYAAFQMSTLHSNTRHSNTGWWPESTRLLCFYDQTCFVKKQKNKTKEEQMQVEFIMITIYNEIKHILLVTFESMTFKLLMASLYSRATIWLFPFRYVFSLFFLKKKR